MPFRWPLVDSAGSYPRPALRPFTVDHYANFGTGEPWVARIMLGLKDLVYAVPAFGATRDDFVNELGEVFESLGMAFQELRKLREHAATSTPVLEQVGSYASFYGHLWTAHKDRFQTAMKALGLDMGFLFQKQAAFEKEAAKLVEQCPELADLVTLMRQDCDHFQNGLAVYRNDFLEHRVAEPDPKMLAAFHRLDSAETTFENVWQAMEDYVNLRAFNYAQAGESADSRIGVSSCKTPASSPASLRSSASRIASAPAQRGYVRSAPLRRCFGRAYSSGSGWKSLSDWSVPASRHTSHSSPQ